MPKQQRYSRIKNATDERKAGIYDNKQGKVIVDDLSKKDADKLVKDWNETATKDASRDFPD